MSEEQSRQSEGSSQAGAVNVSDIQELIRRKEEIEAQIKANYEVLESVSVGSGFPGGRGASPGPLDRAPGSGRIVRPRRPALELSAVSLAPWEVQGAATAASVGRRRIISAMENHRCWCYSVGLWSPYRVLGAVLIPLRCLAHLTVAATS